MLLKAILQASRERLTGSLSVAGGRERVLRFDNGILRGYEDGGRALDPLEAILPEARLDRFAPQVDAYVARLEGRRWELRADAKIPRRLLRGGETIVADALSTEGCRPSTLVARGVDERRVNALFFAAALCGRLQPARAAMAGPSARPSGQVPKRISYMMGDVRVSRKPPRRSSASMAAVSGVAPRAPVSRAPVSRAPVSRVPVSRVPVSRVPGPRPSVSCVARMPREPVGTEPSARPSGALRLASLSEELGSAAAAYDRAQLALQRLDTAGAIELATIAVAREPTHPDYVALLAFARAEAKGSPALGDGGHYDEELAVLNALCDHAARPAVAHYYRARLLKRLRRRDEAQADFARALELDPSNVDAARELRGPGRRRSSGAMAAVRLGRLGS
jgi:Tetratricopeptide repeat